MSLLKMCVKAVQFCSVTSMKCLLQMKANPSTVMWITPDFAESFNALEMLRVRLVAYLDIENLFGN